MHRSVSIVALTLTLAALAQAQDLVHLDSHSNRLKVQNGQFISWENVSTDPSANQVKIYSKQGSLLTTIPILRLVPEALRVTIFDVATNPSGMVTIAAVYGREQGKLPASTLLYFDA